MRMIDADAMKAEVESLDAESNNRIYQCAMEDMLEFFVELIDKQPTIEPEVRHGRWIEESANEYYCSYCGKYAPIAKNMRHCDCSKWCKECGTKMDGGAEDVRSKTD